MSRERTRPHMYLITTILDTLFPLSAHARLVREMTPELLAEEYVPQTIEGAVVLTSYRAERMQALLHEAKFHRNTAAIALLGELLATHFKKHGKKYARGGVRLVPLPLSRERLRERGYNQTVLIVRAAEMHVPQISIDESLLVKIRHTQPQTSLPRRERLTNLAGVFAAGAHALPLDTPLIVFDDITTTGATLAEASRTLKSAGFTRVQKLALAH